MALQHLLAEDGRWGVMKQSRWDAFLDWLSGVGGCRCCCFGQPQSCRAFDKTGAW